MKKNKKIMLGKKIIGAKLVERKLLAEDIFELIYILDTKCKLELCAGQFANVRVEVQGVFLRRPFSVFSYCDDTKRLGLIVKSIGRGTKHLVSQPIASETDMLLPLGRGFSVPIADEKVLLVGGGSGLAPILFLAKSIANKQNVNVVIGAQNKEQLCVVEEYHQFANFSYSTNDGSYGEKGLLTENSFLKDLGAYDRIYCCGPLPMMKAIAKLAHAQAVDCEVSLENTMACGVGVCLCCVEPTNTGNRCVCTEGAVFNIKELTW
ncbi:MAG: dihydroorotate dehydrogenase electron transfer subunit [Bacteroidales bacterium]